MLLRSHEPPPQLLVLLPPSGGGDIHTFPPVASVVESTRYYRDHLKLSGNTAVVDAHVIADPLLGVDVLELGVHGQLPPRIPHPVLEIPCYSPLPILTLHIETQNKHAEIELHLSTRVAGRSQERILTLSTRRSTLKGCSSTGSVTVPLTLDNSGWSVLELDLRDAVRLAWGEQFEACLFVKIGATLRIAAVYFVDRPLPNSALPEWLSVGAGLKRAETKS